MNANEIVNDIIVALELTDSNITDENKQAFGEAFINEIISAVADGDEPDFIEALTIIEYDQGE